MDNKKIKTIARANKPETIKRLKKLDYQEMPKEEVYKYINTKTTDAKNRALKQIKKHRNKKDNISSTLMGGLVGAGAYYGTSIKSPGMAKVVAPIAAIASGLGTKAVADKKTNKVINTLDKRITRNQDFKMRKRVLQDEVTNTSYYKKEASFGSALFNLGSKFLSRDSKSLNLLKRVALRDAQKLRKGISNLEGVQHRAVASASATPESLKNLKSNISHTNTRLDKVKSDLGLIKPKVAPMKSPSLKPTSVGNKSSYSAPTSTETVPNVNTFKGNKMSNTPESFFSKHKKTLAIGAGGAAIGAGGAYAFNNQPNT